MPTTKRTTARDVRPADAFSPTARSRGSSARTGRSRSTSCSVVIALLLFFALPAFATTTNNDDSCDIGLYPAATLLLPYFEVETARHGTDTLFTITNVSRLPQIAHVTIWTDWAYPVLTFNLFLTGYDVQSISLFDVMVRGVVPATSSNTTPGILSATNGINPNLAGSACDQLPGTIPSPARSAIVSALVTGIDASSCGSKLIGSPAAFHTTATAAVGYVTIDVTSRCSTTLPTNPEYFANEILFDNVLIGDYQTVTVPAFNGGPHSAGNPLVHIRAIPEGGPAGAAPMTTNFTKLPYTFYDRYIANRTIGGVPMFPHIDRRQPLGATFSAPWTIESPIQTLYKIWREGTSDGGLTCASAASNAALPFREIVRFDEHENPSVSGRICLSLCTPLDLTLPATSAPSVTSSRFPPILSTPGDRAGWMYMNLDSGLAADRASQNWAIVSMSNNASLSAEFDATSLGNGCAAPVAKSTANGGTAVIAPAKHDEDNCDIGLYPAATLLLPYFEVETAFRGTDTLFTIINTSPQPQIARVNVWTTWAFPVLSFNVFLTGYDVQSISMYDVLVRNALPATSSNTTPGAISACELPSPAIAPVTRTAILSALITGIYNAAGFQNSCGTASVGSPASAKSTATTAAGYVTIDVTSRCTTTSPASADYYTKEILFDNVLTGDYQTITVANPKFAYSSGNPLVHIRAAEGLPYTFYGRYVNRVSPHADRRQPLPSTFALRWADLPNTASALFKIWREGGPLPVTCANAAFSASTIPFREIVRFDEHENARTTRRPEECPSLCVLDPTFTAAASLDPLRFAFLGTNDDSGWIYLNLDSRQSDQTINTADHPALHRRASQNWVTVSMLPTSSQPFAAEFDATALGNGCSPPSDLSPLWHGTTEIGPAGGVLVCPPGFRLLTSSACTPAYTGTNANP